MSARTMLRLVRKPQMVIDRTPPARRGLSRASVATLAAVVFGVTCFAAGALSALAAVGW